MDYIKLRKTLTSIIPFVGRYIPSNEDVISKVTEFNAHKVLGVSGCKVLTANADDIESVLDVLRSARHYSRDDQYRINWIVLEFGNNEFYEFKR